MSASERLAQEDKILREIRVALSTLDTTRESVKKHRKGVAYASSALTTGPRLYELARKLGASSLVELKQAEPGMFREQVMEPNMREGARFARDVAAHGWRLVIEPGKFFAAGWTQEHYMSLWRQVIITMAGTIAFNRNVYWSTGGAEELLIGVQYQKRLLDHALKPLNVKAAVGHIERAIDEIDGMGFDALPLYTIWRELTLTLEAKHKSALR